MERSPRGIYTERSRRPLLVTPTPEQITRILQTPGAEYFSRLGDQPVMLPDTLHDLAFMLDMPEEYQVYTLRGLFGRSLIERVEERFKGVTSNTQIDVMGGNVAIRGTACSLDGHYAYKKEVRYNLRDLPEEIEVDIGSLEDIMEGKAEHGGTAVNVEPVDLQYPERVYPIGKFPNTYLFYHASQLRQELRTHGADDSAIFPILVIYNLDFCKGNFGDGYHIHFPKDRDEAKKAVLGSIVLDYPLPFTRDI